MVGPTWTRVRLTLGSDCLPALSQGTTSCLPCVPWTAYCSHAHDSMIRMVQGCISMLHLSMSPWGLFPTSYSATCMVPCVKKQPSQGVLHGDAAEKELGLARLVSSYTLPHQNSQPGGRGWQTARSKVLSSHLRDM